MKSLQLPFGEQQSRFGIQHRHISSSLMTFHVSSSSLSSPSSPSSSSSFSSSSFSCAAAPAVFERQTLLGKNAFFLRWAGSPLVPMLLVRAAPAVAPLTPMGALHCRSLLRAVSGSGLRILRLPVLGQTVLFPVPATNRGTFTRRFHVRQAKGGMCGSQGHTSLAACRRGAAWARARCSAGTSAASPPPSPCAPTHRGWP